LTICAERVAIFAALASGARELRGLAVSCPAALDGPIGQRMPCGACRQVLSEWLAPQAEVLVDGVGRFAPADLLPNAFRLQRDAQGC
jgi:cytidine deaminase